MHWLHTLLFLTYGMHLNSRSQTMFLHPCMRPLILNVNCCRFVRTDHFGISHRCWTHFVLHPLYAALVLVVFLDWYCLSRKSWFHWAARIIINIATIWHTCENNVPKSWPTMPYSLQYVSMSPVSHDVAFENISRQAPTPLTGCMFPQIWWFHIRIRN